MANDIIKNEEKKLLEPLLDDLKPIIDESKSFEQRAQDVATVIATKEALSDGTLIDELSEKKKKEFVNVADANVKKGQALNKNAEKKLQKADFEIYEGLAAYMGLKRDLPHFMLKILMFFAQLIIGPVLLISGLIVATVNVLLDGINSIMEKFAELSENTRKIVKSLFWIITSVIIIYVAYFLLRQYLGIDLQEIFK